MLSFAGRPNGQLLEMGGTFWKEQAGNWVARVPEPEKRRVVRAEAWWEVVTHSEWKMVSRDGSGESGVEGKAEVEGKAKG